MANHREPLPSEDIASFNARRRPALRWNGFRTGATTGGNAWSAILIGITGARDLAIKRLNDATAPNQCPGPAGATGAGLAVQFASSRVRSSDT